MIDNCQSAGGSAVIIVNNVPGALDVTLNGGTVITIPAIGVTTEDGATLTAALGKTLTVSEENRYAYADGTSFASPHVAGAAAAIWQMCPSCTNLQVRSCLEGTALDLGASGRDDLTGSGLIQMSDAYSCLANTKQCCQSAAPAASSHVPAPSPVPAETTPYPTMISTEPPCASEELAYGSCFTSDMSDSGASCAGCLNSYVYDLSGDCDSVAAAICSGLSTCDCGPCRDSLETYYSCLLPTLDPGTSCTLACPDTATPTAQPVAAPVLLPSAAPVLGPTGSPTTSSPTSIPSSTVPDTPVPTPAATDIPSALTPAPISTMTTLPPSISATQAPSSAPSVTTLPPSSVDTCLAESDTYEACFNTTLSVAEGETCRACIDSAVGALSALTACDDGSSASVCEAVALCPCGECTSPMESFVSCKSETSNLGCSLPCSNLTTTSSCQNEREAYSVCLFSDQMSTNESLSCRDCVSASQTSVVAQLGVDCPGVQAQACGAFENTCLGCGTCSIVARDYLLCQVNEHSSGSCIIDCTGASEGTPVPEPDPAPSPATDDSGMEAPSTSSSELRRISPLAAAISGLAALWYTVA
jgi:Subtilase family/PA domain